MDVRVAFRMKRAGARQSSYDSLVEQAEAVRDQIRGLHSKLAGILSLQNTLIPVGQLSDDVLLHAFSFLMPSLVDACLDADVRAICGVSRRWRMLAMSSCMLWTQVPAWRETGAIQASLERSKNMPLDIVVRVNFDSKPAYDLLAAENQRIRSLTIKYDGVPQSFQTRPQPIARMATKLLGVALHSPSLELLNLSGAGYENLPLALPVRVSHSPRSIVVHNGSVDFIPRSCTKYVAHFSFSRDLRATSDYDMASLIKTLARMPNLETFSLLRTEDMGGQVFDTCRASLPKLRLFKADQACPHNITRLFKSLDISDTARILIVWDDMKAFPRLSDSSIFHSISSLEVIRTEGESCVSLRAHLPEPGLDGTTVRAEMVLRKPGPTMGIASVRAATVGSGAPVLEKVTLRGIRPHIPPQQRYWVGRGIPDCRTLMLEGCSTDIVMAVLEALGGEEKEHRIEGLNWPPAGSAGHLFCATLRAIEVVGLVLVRDDDGEAPDGAAVRAEVSRMRARRVAMGGSALDVTVSDV